MISVEGHNQNFQDDVDSEYIHTDVPPAEQRPSQMIQPEDPRCAANVLGREYPRFGPIHGRTDVLVHN